MRCLLAIAGILMVAPFVWADGGVALGQLRGEGLLVTVFAAPVPARAGPLDLTLLIQDAASNQTILDAGVVCTAVKSGPSVSAPARLPAWCAAIPPGSNVRATTSHSRNKLLYGAYLPITEPGRWRINVTVERGEAKVTGSFPLDAGPPAQPLGTWWPLVALVPAAIFLFWWRGCLRQSARSSRPGSFL